MKEKNKLVQRYRCMRCRCRFPLIPDTAPECPNCRSKNIRKINGENQERTKHKLGHFNYFIIGMIIGMLLVAGLFLYSQGRIIRLYPNLKQEDDFKNCANYSAFIEKVECLNRFIKSIYFYNSSQKYATEFTLEDIKKMGGVCYHYATLYKKMAEAIGLYGKEVGFPLNDTAHSIAIISDKNNSQYCIADQTEIWCKELGN